MILTIDDDKMVQTCLKHVFEEAGYKVYQAKDALEALDMLRSGLKPRVIILDWIMPGMDGDDFLYELKKIDNNIPVVIFSAYVGEIRDEVRSQVQGIMAKPVDVNAMVAEVARWAPPSSRGLSTATPEGSSTR